MMSDTEEDLLEPNLSIPNSPGVILLTHDGLYARVFLDAFIRTGGVRVLGIVRSTAIFRRGWRPLTELIVFVHRVGVAYALYQLWVAVIRPVFSPLPSIDTYCRTQGIPLFSTADINNAASVAFIDGLQPDFVLCFHFNQKLLTPALHTAKIATINVHPAYLPDLGGVDPVWFHLATGTGRLGVTVHRMTAEIDRGDILDQRVVAGLNGGLVELNSILFASGGRLAAEVLSDFAAHDAARQPQPELAGSYYGWHDIRRHGVWQPLFRRIHTTVS